MVLQILWRGIVYVILVALALWLQSLWMMALLLFFAIFDMAWWAEIHTVNPKERKNLSDDNDKMV